MIYTTIVDIILGKGRSSSNIKQLYMHSSYTHKSMKRIEIKILKTIDKKVILSTDKKMITTTYANSPTEEFKFIPRGLSAKRISYATI